MRSSKEIFLSIIKIIIRAILSIILYIFLSFMWIIIIDYFSYGSMGSFHSTPFSLTELPIMIYLLSGLLVFFLTGLCNGLVSKKFTSAGIVPFVTILVLSLSLTNFRINAYAIIVAGVDRVDFYKDMIGLPFILLGGYLGLKIRNIFRKVASD